MTEEELRLKLGLDTSELDAGTRRALQSIGNFGQEAHKSFMHGDSAAKGFKKTLHELTEAMPALGWSLRALISPVGAAFAALAAGIGFATKAIDDFQKKSAETSAKNELPIDSPNPGKWKDAYRVRDAVAGNDPSSSGISNAEAERQAKAMNQWDRSKQRAADLVRQREKDAEEAAKAYREHREKAGDAFTPEGVPWYREIVGGLNGVLLGITGQWGADPNIYTDSATAKYRAKSDELYHNKLMSQVALRQARDQQSKLEGDMPHTISRGLWGMLNLTNAVGATSRAAVQLKTLLPKFDFDADTGGVKYHGIDNKLLPGALGYVKPSPGAPGYVPGTGDVTKMFDTPVEKLQQQVAVLLMQWGTNGVPVIGKEQ